MKRLIYLLLLFPFSAIAQEGKQFQLTGKIEGLADSWVRITTTSKEPVVVASDSSRNGNFVLKGSVPEPGLYFLVMGSEQPQYLYLENATFTVMGNRNDLKGLKYEGSQAQLDFLEFNQVFNPIMGNLNAVAAQLQKEFDPAGRDQLRSQYDSMILVLSNAVGQFVTTHPSSPVSPFLLWVTAQVTPNILILEKHYQTLDTAISRQTQIGKSLGEYIAFNKVGAVGTDAVDFTQADTSGKNLALSSFRGKYVLVDFWASWCGPCRRENPNIVKVYNKYKDKNFTVLGVSLDQQKEPWVKAIQKDQLHWSHVSDLKFWENEAAKLYRISSIPGNFLMDPSGKIIAKDLHGEELEKALAKYLGPVKDSPSPQKGQTKKEQVKKNPTAKGK